MGQLTFSETWVMKPGAVTTDYLLALQDLAGKFNEAGFRGFDGDKVRFLGTSEPAPDPEGLKVVFRFEVEPPATDCPSASFDVLGLGI